MACWCVAAGRAAESARAGALAADRVGSSVGTGRIGAAAQRGYAPCADITAASAPPDLAVPRREPRDMPETTDRTMPPSRRLLVSIAAVAALVTACSGGTGGDGPDLDPLAAQGRAIVNRSGCTGCHGAAGQGGLGPAWVGLAGSTVQLDDGSTVTADDAYLRESILEPSAKTVDGYGAAMPTPSLTETEVDAIVAYIRALAAAE